MVVPKKGSSIRRVGLFNWIAGKRYADGLIDYDTNVDDIDVEFKCSTS